MVTAVHLFPAEAVVDIHYLLMDLGTEMTDSDCKVVVRA
jgi:hypothetical protein